MWTFKLRRTLETECAPCRDNQQVQRISAENRQLHGRWRLPLSMRHQVILFGCKSLVAAVVGADSLEKVGKQAHLRRGPSVTS